MQASFKKTMFLAFLVPLAAVILVWRFSPWTRARVRQFFYPFQRATVGVDFDSDTKVKNMSQQELISTVIMLREKADRLEDAERQVSLLQRVNRNLRALANVGEPPKFKRVGGYVLDRDPAKGGRIMRLNVGTKASVQPGYAVLSGNDLIGRVGEVTKDTCLVRTLIDPGCRIPARIMGKKVYGTLVGAGEEGWKRNPFCQFRHLPRDLEYKEGEVVVTSEHSQYFPPYLHIGTISPRSDGSMIQVKDNLYKNAWVKPTAFDADYSIFTVLVPIPPDEAAAPPVPSDATEAGR